MNKVLTGSSGYVWFNGKKLANVKSIEAKITGNFEEVNFVGEYATHSVYTGWAGEGTLVVEKIDSTVLKLLADAYKTGDIPEVKITTKLTDKGTGKSERTSINDAVITEFALAKFEAKALVEEELPFKFSDYDFIEAI
jgi:hypothetical protein